MTAPTDAMDPEETLARWRAEEAAVRARLRTAPGVASPGLCRPARRSDAAPLVPGSNPRRLVAQLRQRA